MKILLANTLHFRSGGPSVYTFNLAEMLANAGHEVAIFSMQHNLNIESSYANYFPSNIDYPALLKEGGIGNMIKVLSRTFYSTESKKSISDFLDDFQPDILHLQNYLHHLTPSIINPARKRNIPVIWTLHDSVLVCPNTNLFNDTLREPCTKCNSLFKRLIYPVRFKCKKESRAASLVASIEAFSFQMINLYDKIDCFVSPSKFLINQLGVMGYKTSDKFDYLPLFVENEESSTNGEYILYLGRIVPEKGVDDLIEAIIPHNDIKLVIAGGGAYKDKLALKVENLKLKNISLTGHISGNELRDMISNARFVVVPSRCYENAPLSIIESFSFGKPVIGSKIGGIPELIDDGKTGLLFDVKDVLGFSEKIRYLWDNQDVCFKMGQNAKAISLSRHAPKKHLDGILKIYERFA